MSFGKLLGKTKFNVAVYSNAGAPTKRPRNFFRGEFTGLRYECVEFARRFLIAAKQVTFPSVRSAAQIWDIKRFVSVNQKEEVQLRHYYPTVDTRPMLGDLVIFARSVDAPHGHVGVVINCRRYRDKLFVYFCDQNFTDKPMDRLYNGRMVVSADGITTDRGTVIGLVGLLEK